MSKGGAGKVYFVLYLAVILELLIIIVERDEAEEHLIAKQKESMKIVQSILSQLQTGTGVEGLSTRPQDQIVLKDPSWANQPGMNLIEEDRRYQVDVGVTDVLNDIPKILRDERMDEEYKSKRLKDFALASNVKELQYQIWFTPVKDTVPVFPTDAEIDDIVRPFETLNKPFQPTTKGDWTLVGYRTAVYNEEATMKTPIPLDIAEAIHWFKTVTPVYEFHPPKGDYASFAPPDTEKKPQFTYDHPMTISLGGGNNLRSIKVRSFVSGFKPAGGREGIFKLHFFSRTNKIMGVRSETAVTSDDIPDDAKVNIGTVQLKVKDLRSVLKELERTLADAEAIALTRSFNSGQVSAKEYREKIQERVQKLQNEDPEEARDAKLYAYINMILSPTRAYEELEQNQASMGFTVRVVKPNIPTADPFVEYERQSMYAYAGVGAAFFVTTGPATPGTPRPDGYVEGNGQKFALQFEQKGVGDQVAAAAGAQGAGSTRWMAYTTQSLSKGTWNVSISQVTGGKRSEEKASITVFGINLEDSDARMYVEDLKSRLSAFYYGDQVKFNAIAGAPDDASVKKIDQRSFRITVSSDRDSQGKVFTGLNAEGPVDEEAQNYNVTFTWQNARGENVTLLKAEQIPVMQRGPVVGRQISNATAYSAGAGIEATGVITVSKPSNLAADASVKIPKPTVSVVSNQLRGITGASVNVLGIEEDGDGTFRVRVEISGDVDREASVVSGSVSLKVVAGIVNPKNRKSGSTTANLTLPINAAIEKQTRQKRKR